MNITTWNDIKAYLKTNNIKALPAKGYVVIPTNYEDRETGETSAQFDDITTVCADLQPLKPEGYKVHIPDTSRKHPDECILIGIDSDITDYAFDNIK